MSFEFCYRKQVVQEAPQRIERQTCGKSGAPQRILICLALCCYAVCQNEAAEAPVMEKNSDAQWSFKNQ